MLKFVSHPPPNVALAAVAALGALALAQPAAAQVYTSSQFAAPYVQVTGGTPVAFGSNDDDSTLVQLGFPFVWYGVTYTAVNVATNGFAVLAESCMTAVTCPNFGLCTGGACELGFASTGAPGPFPDTEEPNSIIAPFWDDLYVQAGSQVLTAVEGSAPNRVFVIEWRNIGHYPSGTVGAANFQVRLAESGTVRMAWGSASGATTWDGNIGLENPDGTVGFAPNLACGVGPALCSLADLQSLNGQVLEVGPVDGPELLGAVSPPPGADPGQPLSIAVSARNIGTRSTTVAIVARVYLSTDTTITPGTDTFLGQVTLPVVPARDVRTATLATSLPSMLMPGRYRIGAIVDATNLVREATEANNTALSGEFLVGPDVEVAVTAPGSTGPSEPISVPVVITSRGSPVISTLYRMYLSADPILDVSDALVGTGTAAVAGQPSLSFQAQGVVPANIIPVAYYVIVVVDANDTLLELDETNNVGVSEDTVDVVGPDVAVTDITCDANAYRGQPFTMRATLRNVGGTTAHDFYYTFYFSDNQLVTATDPAVCEFGPITLAPGIDLQVEHVCTIPVTLPLVPYYVGIIADSTTVVLEGDERNNIRFRRPTVPLRDPAPDLVVQDLEVPALAAVGESLTIGRTLDNIGNAPASGLHAYYLSADRSFDAASDVEIGRGSSTIPAGGRVSGVDAARIPLGVAPGAYYIVGRADPDGAVAELDETNNVFVSVGSVRLEAAELQILSRALPQGTVGLPYQFELAAAGAGAGLTWSLTRGVLPGGLTLDAATGRLSGTPRAAGRVELVVRVDDGRAHAEATLTLLIAESTVDLAIITRALPPSFLGRAYEIPLTAIGGIPPYVWTYEGAMPPGLRLDADGRLAGTPTSVGPSTINFRVRDVAGTQVEQPITVRVVASEDALRFTTDILRDGEIGQRYEDRFRATNGQPAYTFEQVGGDLPGGLAIEDDKLVGTPTVAGTFVFAVRVSDQRADFDTNRYVVTITSDEDVRFVSNGLPSGVRGVAYVEEGGAAVRLKAVSATGMSEALAYTVLSGDLPPGITLAPDGVLAGTPTAAGLYTFVAEVIDGAGRTDHRALSIVVEDPPVVVPPPGGDGGCGCTSSAQGSGASWMVGLALVLGLVRLGRRSRAPLLALVAVVSAGALAPHAAQAQVPYFLQEDTAPYVVRSGGTALTFVSNDDSDAVVTLPFPFRFFSTSHSSVNVGTNGYVVFGSSAGSLDNLALGSVSPPNNVIAAFWDDLVVQNVTTYLDGTAPSRVFVIQWVANRFGGGGDLAAQLWLYEGAAGRFELRYGAGSGNSFSAALGFENDSGSVSHTWRTCSPNCQGSDLSALQDRVLRALQDGGTDVEAVSVSSPARVFAGAPFAVSATFRSYHQNDVGPIGYGYRLYPANSMQGGIDLASFGPVTLTPYQVVSATDLVTIPVLTAPGVYRIALVIDPAQGYMEPDEGNNLVFATNTIEIGDRRPDLTAGRIVARPATANPGDTVSVVVEVQNAGNLPGGGQWQLVLSGNRVISSDDLVVHTGSVSLGIVESVTTTVSVTLSPSLEPGRYYFGVITDPMNTLLELSEVNNAVVARDPIDVGVDFVMVANESLPGGYVGVEYSTFLRGAGGDGTYTWSLASGTLPAGLSLLPMAGEIRGRPTAAGSSEVTVRVSSGGRMADKALTLVVAERGGPLTIVTRGFVPGVVGQAYPPSQGEQRVRVVNDSGSVSYRLTGLTPPGLALSTDGVLSGLPRQRGTFDVEVEARDSVGTATRSIPLTIVEPGRLSLVAASLPEGVLDDEYRFQLVALGATATVTFALGQDQLLPDGLTLTSAGLIVGVPTRVGTWRFSVRATEGTATDDANFAITVVSNAGFGITPSSLPVATVGVPYDVTVEARGGQPMFTWRLVLPGTLPRGLRWEVETNGDRERVRFLGTAEAVPDEGVVSFLLTVDDLAGRHAEQALAIRVVPPPVVVVAPPPDGGCSCASTQAGAGLPGLLLLAGLMFALRRRPRV